ncbi:MAG TPA: transcription elongation factor GreA [Chloroflexota bacterium]
MPSATKEHSRGSSQPQSNPTTGQAVASYLFELAPGEKTMYALELNSFARWFGVQKPIRSVTAPDLGNYQEQLAAQARTDLGQRLEALKSFFQHAKRMAWTDTNLAVEIKLKKTKGAAPKTASPARASSPAPSSNGASANGDAIRLTREGYNKLAEELEHLETVMRPQIALELKTAAADKDFKENAPYDVAKQHQGEIEARIRHIKNVLETGEVVEEAQHAHIIDIGSVVTLHDLDEDEDIVYTLVGPGEIDPRKGKISIQSPVGRALTGKVVGDHVEVEVPAGRLKLRVRNVERR